MPSFETFAKLPAEKKVSILYPATHPGGTVSPAPAFRELAFDPFKPQAQDNKDITEGIRAKAKSAYAEAKKCVRPGNNPHIKALIDTKSSRIFGYAVEVAQEESDRVWGQVTVYDPQFTRIDIFHWEQ